MSPAQLAQWQARMAARAAREQATTPAPTQPASQGQPTPPAALQEGQRTCRACGGTGKVAGTHLCPSCMGVGWKWMGPVVQEPPAYNLAAGSTCRWCKARDAGDPCADCLNDQQAT